jgi:hypothetical protein
MGIILVGIGVWLFSDALYSYSLYLDRLGTDGKRIQNWRRDHWVRLVRAILAIIIIIIGVKL